MSEPVGRRSGISLRNPVLSAGFNHDRRRQERTRDILAVVTGKLPGESLREASVRIVGHDLWASVVERPPPRREVAPKPREKPRRVITEDARQRKNAKRRAVAAAIRDGTYVRTRMGSPEYSARLREVWRSQREPPAPRASVGMSRHVPPEVTRVR
jgi:hypothetical protein